MIMSIIEFIIALFIILWVFKVTPIQFWLVIVFIALVLKGISLFLNNKYTEEIKKVTEKMEKKENE